MWGRQKPESAATMAPALFDFGQLDGMEKKGNQNFSLPHLNGENWNSAFCSVVDSRGVTHVDEAEDARAEAATGPKKSPRLVVVAKVGALTGALPGRSKSPVAAREEAAPISR